MVIAITAAFAWLQPVVFLIGAGQTTWVLHSCDSWLRLHGYALAVAGLGIGGVLLTLGGILGFSAWWPGHRQRARYGSRETRTSHFVGDPDRCAARRACLAKHCIAGRSDWCATRWGMPNTGL